LEVRHHLGLVNEYAYLKEMSLEFDSYAINRKNSTSADANCGNATDIRGVRISV